MCLITEGPGLNPFCSWFWGYDCLFLSLSGCAAALPLLDQTPISSALRCDTTYGCSDVLAPQIHWAEATRAAGLRRMQLVRLAAVLCSCCLTEFSTWHALCLLPCFVPA